jgi:hypothetical protein
MSDDRTRPVSEMRDDLRARNRRLGLILASVALVFFVGVIVKYVLAQH